MVEDTRRVCPSKLFAKLVGSKNAAGGGGGDRSGNARSESVRERGSATLEVEEACPSRSPAQRSESFDPACVGH